MINFHQKAISLNRKHELSYDVFFLNELFDLKKEGLRKYCKKEVFIVIDSIVFKHYGFQIINYFDGINSKYKLFVFDALEKNKNMEAVLKICDSAQQFRMQRDSVFIGIGGGITLDVLGFAASIFRRKTAYIRIPTTLLGMVDAGVGLKVGVNFNRSKNFLGAYYAPVATFNDQSFLYTLDLSNIRNGLYEMIKMALCNDKLLFQLIEQHYGSFLKRQFDSRTDEIIRLSALSMMQELDPNLYENKLQRKVDFGHTFSPYIEESSGYSVQHGEAVKIDILISSFIALKRGIMSPEDFQRVYKLIYAIGDIDTADYINLIDPKNLHKALDSVRAHRAGNLNLVLPTKIGKCVFTQKCTVNELISSLKFYRKEKYHFS